MPTRNSEAVWEGDLKGGKGSVKLGSGAYQGAYSFQSRFESGAGTNPEELIAAAHAGCFSMAFAGALGRAEFPPTRVHTTANVHLEKTDAARPGQYYSRGAWHRMDTIDYQVAVRGEGPVPHTVELTAHGPVVQLLICPLATVVDHRGAVGRHPGPPSRPRPDSLVRHR